MDRIKQPVQYSSLGVGSPVTAFSWYKYCSAHRHPLDFIGDIAKIFAHHVPVCKIVHSACPGTRGWRGHEAVSGDT